MHHEQLPEHPSMHCGSIHEVFGFLTEEQIKKVALMKLDIKIQMMEMKIKEMESAIEIKKKIIADIKQVQEMIKTKK
jgi:hypothetical protein